jgi:phage FluMu protein gp41
MPSTPQSYGHPSRSAIEVLKNYIGVISQVNGPFSGIDGAV